MLLVRRPGIPALSLHLAARPGDLMLHNQALP